MRRALATRVAALLLLAPHSARGEDEAAPLTALLERTGAQVAISFDITESFTEEFRQRLGGGLKSRALIEMALLDPSGRLIAAEVRECRLRFEIWDDVIDLRIRDGQIGQSLRFLLIDDALRACGRIRRVPMTDLALLQKPRGYGLRVFVRLNPVSDELIHQTREFLSNPRGSPIERSRSFFGYLWGLFGSGDQVGGEIFEFEANGLTRPTEKS